MGNLVYPGKNRKLLSSLRLENLRDGLEDYEYLVKLKQLIIEGKQIGCDKDFLAEAEKILVIPDNVAQAINRYSGEPAYLMNYRDRLADAIEKLSEKINEKKVALNEAER